jgi:hypothetical protein
MLVKDWMNQGAVFIDANDGQLDYELDADG